LKVSKSRERISAVDRHNMCQGARERRGSVHRDIGVSKDVEISHQEITIRDFSMSVLDRSSSRTCGGRSRQVDILRHRGFQVVKRLHIEIAIDDFPTWSEPLIGGGHVERYPEQSRFVILVFLESSAMRKLKSQYAIS
jgi:hypothetical protein